MKRKLFSKWTIILYILGLIVNIFLSKLVIWLGLPVFFDNIGSILVAALAGAIPGMLVGFLTNAINSVSDPITMYYGILSIIITVSAVQFSKKGYFKSKRKCILIALWFAFIGGAVGSVMTWMLYGGGIGVGISAPYAIRLNRMGVSEFWAQFTADIIIDIIDKFLSVGIIYTILYFYPKKLLNVFPLSYIYNKNQAEVDEINRKTKSYYKKHSINSRIMLFIIVTAILTSGTSIAVGLFNYQAKIKKQYREIVVNATKYMSYEIDGDMIDEYIKEGFNAPGYEETRNRLEYIYNSFEDITYLYVYKVEEDGCHVVFDFNSNGVIADKPGDIVHFDKSFSKYYEDLINGKAIKPIITNDTFGWLYTSYYPISDSNGNTIAYACADISMNQYVEDLLVYNIRIAGLLFGIIIIITAFVTWYAENKIVIPLNDIIEQSNNFDDCPPEKWLNSSKWLEKEEVKTGDEIETLYNVVCKVEENVVNNVIKIKETEQKLIQSKEIEKKNEELAVALKKADEANASKTQFLSNVSHDMRTPLNSVIGFTNLAKDADNIKEKDEMLLKIDESARYLLGLINDTLDLSKMETGKIRLDPHSVKWKNFLDSIVTCNKSAADAKNIEIILEDEGVEIDSIFVDELKLKQVFNNIISNAVKFTRAGGKIIFSSEKELLNKYCVKCKFTMSDNGIGMSEEFLPHVFEPFEQENPYESGNYTGTGLGLSIVKQIVDLMGGEIEVESRIKEGTTFNIYLNLQIAKSEEKQHSSVIDENILKNKKILLCEDHPMNIELAKRLLLKKGMSVDVAMNGKEGYEIFMKSDTGHYDVILMDIRMPVMDGIEATKMIRKLDRNDAKCIPIIAMTANAYDDDRENTKSAGMSAHLAKPIDPEIMYATIAEKISDYRK